MEMTVMNYDTFCTNEKKRMAAHHEWQLITKKQHHEDFRCLASTSGFPSTALRYNLGAWRIVLSPIQLVRRQLPFLLFHLTVG